MTDNFAEQLLRDRQARDAARATFENRLSQVRGGLADQGPGGRVAYDLWHQAHEAAGEAADVARESRGVVIATGLVLIGYLLRTPLLRLGQSITRSREPFALRDRFRAWLKRKA